MRPITAAAGSTPRRTRPAMTRSSTSCARSTPAATAASAAIWLWMAHSRAERWLSRDIAARLTGARADGLAAEEAGHHRQAGGHHGDDDGGHGGRLAQAVAHELQRQQR